MGLNLQGRYCEWCQGIYQPKRKGQRFCCPKHRAAWHRSDLAVLRDMAQPDSTVQFCPHCGRKP